MILRYSIILSISVVTSITIYYNGIYIEYSDVKDILGALLNISSIIFAIIGAWVAIIYPKAISRVFGPKYSEDCIVEANNDSKYLAELVEIVLVSALVIMSVLMIQFTYPILKKLHCLPSIISQCKVIGFFIITLLTFLQLHAVFRVVLANYFFLNELNKKNIKGTVDLLHK